MIKKMFAGCLAVIVLLLVVIAVGGYLMVRENTPEVKAGSYLLLDMAGDYPEDAPHDFWTLLVEGRTLTVFDVVENIRKARFDDRIEGVLMRVNILNMGYGKVQEIRHALEEFEESGKKVVSYIEIGRDIEYYLASAADEVYMAPVSALMIDGIVGNAFFVRGTFDKLGIKPNFVRIGEYKTAVDLYSSTKMSDAQRWTINSILDSIFSRYVADVAQDRSISQEELGKIIDDGMLDSRQALEKGLVDDLLYPNQLEGKLKGEARKFHGIDLEDYRDADASIPGDGDGVKFALIVAEGAINTGGSGESQDLGKVAGSATLSDAIKSARDDDDIKAIILRTNSPGGSWVASDLVWGELRRAAEEKPLVVSMSDVAASGGYYIAVPADAIVAEPSTITGSIGVYMGKFNLSGFYSKIGVSKETVARGENAEIFSETKDFSEEETDKIYKQLMEFYMNDFVGKVHEGRDLSPAFVDSIGRGRVWTGEQAFELGLVDDLGGIWKAVELGRDLAGIPPDKAVSLVLVPEPKELIEQLLEGDLVFNPPSVRISPVLEEMMASIQWLNTLGSGEAMAMMPYRIEFE